MTPVEAYAQFCARVARAQQSLDDVTASELDEIERRLAAGATLRELGEVRYPDAAYPESQMWRLVRRLRRQREGLTA